MEIAGGIEILTGFASRGPHLAESPGRNRPTGILPNLHLSPEPRELCRQGGMFQLNSLRRSFESRIQHHFSFGMDDHAFVIVQDAEQTMSGSSSRHWVTDDHAFVIVQDAETVSHPLADGISCQTKGD
jgi:hypothetical protein